MRRLFLRPVVNALALWLTTLLISGIHVVPYEQGPGPVILTYLLVALIFGVVNGVIGNLIRIVAFPLYILTLGLISLVVNTLLLLLVAGLSTLLGFGLRVDSFWSGFWGALVLALLSWVIGIVLRRVLAPNHSRRR